MIIPEIIKSDKVMQEKRIESLLHKRVRSLGGDTIKFKADGNRGVTDRIVMYKGHVFFVELKTDTGVISAHQHNFKALMKCHGLNHRFVFGVEGVTDFINELKEIDKC